MASQKESHGRHHSRAKPTLEEQRALSDLFAAKRHPMITAILGACMLEHQLDEILQPRFRRRDSAAWARLTGDNGPLNTLNQKIIVAHSFGAFDDVAMGAMMAVKDIRNRFAHSLRLITFADVSEKLRRITLPNNRRSGAFRVLNEVRDRQKTDPESAYVQLCFFTANLVISYQLRLLRGTARKRSRRKPLINPYVLGLLGSLAPQTVETILGPVSSRPWFRASHPPTTSAVLEHLAKSQSGDDNGGK